MRWPWVRRKPIEREVAGLKRVVERQSRDINAQVDRICRLLEQLSEAGIEEREWHTEAR